MLMNVAIGAYNGRIPVQLLDQVGRARLTRSGRVQRAECIGKAKHSSDNRLTTETAIENNEIEMNAWL